MDIKEALTLTGKLVVQDNKFKCTICRTSKGEPKHINASTVAEHYRDNLDGDEAKRAVHRKAYADAQKSLLAEVLKVIEPTAKAAGSTKKAKK